jgi:hypothetical protein
MNLWLLNVGPDHGGAVVFWDHGSFDTFNESDFAVWPRVANSFQEFIGKVHEDHPLPGEEVLRSRYALVQKAVKQMADSASDFDKHPCSTGLGIVTTTATRATRELR